MYIHQSSSYFGRRHRPYTQHVRGPLLHFLINTPTGFRVFFSTHGEPPSDIICRRIGGGRFLLSYICYIPARPRAATAAAAEVRSFSAKSHTIITYIIKKKSRQLEIQYIYLQVRLEFLK